MKEIDCLQPMPIRCRYCTRFQVHNKIPCSACATEGSWKNMQGFYHCGSFIKNIDRCEVCSLRIQCITGAENSLPFTA